MHQTTQSLYYGFFDTTEKPSFSTSFIPGCSIVCCQLTRVNIVDSVLRYQREHISNLLAGEDKLLVESIVPSQEKEDMQ